MLRAFVFSFFFSSRRRHTRCSRDWSSDVCSSDLARAGSGRKNCSVAVAADGGTTGMRGKGPLLRELLDARDVVAGEADKDGLGRRLAIDPILNIVAFGVTLADFVVGLAHGSDDFFAVHADKGPALLNSFLHLRRQGVDPLHGGGALVLKIEEGRKDFLQVDRKSTRLNSSHGYIS